MLIKDGVILCTVCATSYPVISEIPVLFGDLEAYLAERHSVASQMLRLCSGDAKEMVVSAMPTDPECDSRGSLERRWAAIYQSNGNTEMHRHILDVMPPVSDCTVLEHGCSSGVFSRMLRAEGAYVTGVDTSFPALRMAQQQSMDVRYVVADSATLSCEMFDVVVSLNMLEVVEPRALLSAMISQATQYVVLADPYDYVRGSRTVSDPLYGSTIRRIIHKMGFDVMAGFEKQSFIPWDIRISSRTTIRYLVDLVIAKRR